VKFKYAENLAKDIFSANKTLSEWQIFFRDLLLEKLECSELVFAPSAKDFADKNKISPLSIKKIIEDINKIKKIIGNSSFNARLALENLMLNL
jgi:competence protein ComGF